MTRRRQFTAQQQISGERPKDVVLYGSFNEPYWKTTVKQIDESRNTTTTLTDDAELSTFVAPSETFVIHFEVFYRANLTPDFQFAIDGPASPSVLSIRGYYSAPGTLAATDFLINTFGTAQSVTGTNTANSGHVWVSIYLVNGTTGGAVTFQWAQNTSSANEVIVRAGSYVQSHRVGENA